MKVITGTLGGRFFEAPRGHRTHPMSEKIRGALFNSLGDISGLTVLDAFSGSGALGIEAISRGASQATLIEKDIAATKVIRNNIEQLGIDQQTKVTRANISSWSDNNPDARFNIVLVDPPHEKLQIDTINKITKHLSENGDFIINWPGKQEAPTIVDLSLEKQKSYGDSQLLFYRHASNQTNTTA